MTIELKICGLTTLPDLRVSESIGADYVGMVVEVPYSRRNISRWVAQSLCKAARTRPVLVVATHPPHELTEIACLCRPYALQIHGEESPQEMARLVEELSPQLEIWRGIAIAPAGEDQPRSVGESLALIEDLAQIGVRRIVLDTRVKGEMGGTGVTCDWPTAAQIIAASALPVMLAGGLGPDNIVEAIRATGATGVDMATGVESSPGRKDPRKLRALVAALRRFSTNSGNA